VVCRPLKVGLKVLYTHTSKFLASVTTLTHTNQLVLERVLGAMWVCVFTQMSRRHAHARTCRMNRDLMKETMKRISVSIWPAIRFNPFCVKKSPLRARLLTRRLHAHIIIIIIIYTVMYTVSAENTASSTRRSRLFFFLFSLCWFYIGFAPGPMYCCSLQPTYIYIYIHYIT